MSENNNISRENVFEFPIEIHSDFWKDMADVSQQSTVSHTVLQVWSPSAYCSYVVVWHFYCWYSEPHWLCTFFLLILLSLSLPPSLLHTLSLRLITNLHFISMTLNKFALWSHWGLIKCFLLKVSGAFLWLSSEKLINIYITGFRSFISNNKPVLIFVLKSSL